MIMGESVFLLCLEETPLAQKEQDFNSRVWWLPRESSGDATFEEAGVVDD